MKIYFTWYTKKFHNCIHTTTFKNNARCLFSKISKVWVKKMRHVQKLTIGKKSAILVLFSWNLWGDYFGQVSLGLDKKCEFSINFWACFIFSLFFGSDFTITYVTGLQEGIKYWVGIKLVRLMKFGGQNFFTIMWLFKILDGHLHFCLPCSEGSMSLSNQGYFMIWE